MPNFIVAPISYTDFNNELCFESFADRIYCRTDTMMQTANLAFRLYMGTIKAESFPDNAAIDHFVMMDLFDFDTIAVNQLPLNTEHEVPYRHHHLPLTSVLCLFSFYSLLFDTIVQKEDSASIRGKQTALLQGNIINLDCANSQSATAAIGCQEIPN